MYPAIQREERKETISLNIRISEQLMEYNKSNSDAPPKPNSKIHLQGLKHSVSLSPRIVSGSVAALDTFIIFTTGLIIFHLYLPADAHTVLSLYLGAMGLYNLLILICFYNTALYSFRSLGRPLARVGKLLFLGSTMFSLLLTFAFVIKITDEYSRVWAVSWFLISLTLIILLRFWVYQTLQKWGADKKISRNIAVIGAEEHGIRLLEVINEMKEPWMHVIGVFEDRFSRVPSHIEGSPVLGNVDDLIDYVQEHRVDDVIIALPWSAEERMQEIIEKLEVLPVDIRLSPDMIGFTLLNHSYSHYCGLPVLNISDKPISGWDYVGKMIFDKTLSTIILILIAPIMLLIAIGIKLDSPGPVFFKQKRYGFNNQLIEVLKFRSMRTDMQDDNAEKLATRNDPRITTLGAFLRRTSLDELPQFINVLKGEMSIVGPRPHATRAKAAGKLYQEQVAKYAVRHKVIPGITGWAQVNGWRGETDTEEKIKRRVEHDLYYIYNWSMLLDIKITLRTLFVFVNSKNAY